jgi:hypothetical protein
MSSAEVCGFVLRHEPRENVADALVFTYIINIGHGMPIEMG